MLVAPTVRASIFRSWPCGGETWIAGSPAFSPALNAASSASSWGTSRPLTYSSTAAQVSLLFTDVVYHPSASLRATGAVELESRENLARMPQKKHRYELTVVWTGNLGEGTANYRAYARDHEVTAEGRPAIAGSSDPTFRGDPMRWNPEQLLVASLSQCHLLWYLHLCAVSGVVVMAYEDHPQGVMTQTGDGGGRFTEVVLRPAVTVADESMTATARELHDRAHELCFIANSVNFPVHHRPEIHVE